MQLYDDTEPNARRNFGCLVVVAIMVFGGSLGLLSTNMSLAEALYLVVCTGLLGLWFVWMPTPLSIAVHFAASPRHDWTKPRQFIVEDDSGVIEPTAVWAINSAEAAERWAKEQVRRAPALERRASITIKLADGTLRSFPVRFKRDGTFAVGPPSAF